MKINKKDIRKRIDKRFMIYSTSCRQVRDWLLECERESWGVLDGRHYDDEYESEEERKRITNKIINYTRYWIYSMRLIYTIDEKYLKKRREF